MVAKIISGLWSFKPVRSLTMQMGEAIAAEFINPQPCTIAGRVRVPVTGLRNSPARAQSIEAELSALDGVREVKANHITGKVLIQYDPERLGYDDLRHVIEHEGLGLLPLRSSHPGGEKPRAAKACPRAKLYGCKHG